MFIYSGNFDQIGIYLLCNHRPCRSRDLKYNFYKKTKRHPSNNFFFNKYLNPQFFKETQYYGLGRGVNFYENYAYIDRFFVLH